MRPTTTRAATASPGSVSASCAADVYRRRPEHELSSRRSRSSGVSRDLPPERRARARPQAIARATPADLSLRHALARPHQPAWERHAPRSRGLRRAARALPRDARSERHDGGLGRVHHRSLSPRRAAPSRLSALVPPRARVHPPSLGKRGGARAPELRRVRRRDDLAGLPGRGADPRRPCRRAGRGARARRLDGAVVAGDRRRGLRAERAVLDSARLPRSSLARRQAPPLALRARLRGRLGAYEPPPPPSRRPSRPSLDRQHRPTLRAVGARDGHRSDARRARPHRLRLPPHPGRGRPAAQRRPSRRDRRGRGSRTARRLLRRRRGGTDRGNGSRRRSPHRRRLARCRALLRLAARHPRARRRRDLAARAARRARRDPGDRRVRGRCS